jgi:hypothetical protein
MRTSVMISKIIPIKIDLIISILERHTGFLALGSLLPRFVLCAIVVLSITACAGIGITPGKVYGNISYINTSPDVIAYLSSNPVVPNPGATTELDPVRSYTPGNFVASATAQYTPDNTLIDPQTYQAATYEIHPNADESGTNLLLTVDKLRLSDGALYRFGSIDASSPAAALCSGITPTDTNPSGTQCNFSECPALLDLSLRFTGAQADLDAILDQPTASIPCEAEAYIEDVAGSGDFAYQAASGSHLYTLPELLAGNAHIKLATRGVSSQVQIKLACSVQIKPGETGFVVIPATGRTPLGGESTINSAACGQTVAPPAIDIPVERHAGRLTGYFDVSGHDEAAAEICVDSLSSPFCTNPPLVAATATPTQKWTFEGIPAGPHTVIARAFVGADQLLLFPNMAGANHPVEIVSGSTTDIGATFVSQPITAHGQLKLFDPSGQTDLRYFVSNPFDTSSWESQIFTSTMAAQGDSGMAPEPNGASGYGAHSYSRLMGVYDAMQNLAQLDYSLYLNGLSYPGGNLDGSEARPTPWKVDSFNLNMTSPSGNRKSVSVSLATNLNYTANPSQPPAGGAFEVPEQRICFSSQTVQFNVNPLIGSFSRVPDFYVSSIPGTYYPSTLGVAPINYASAHSFGTFANYPDTQSASVSVTLPEGFQYQGYSILSFIPAGGDASQETTMYLDPIAFPAEGGLGCGQNGGVCIDLQDGTGHSTQLSVSVTDSSGSQTPAYCTSDGNLDLRVDVGSQGVDVMRVAYQLDPASTDDCQTGPAQELCATGCGPDPSFPINLTGLTPGQHSLRVCATSSTGCTAFENYSFDVDVQPPMLQCAPDFNVSLLSGETSVLATDPRVADNLGTQVQGNCGLPVGISDDRPAEFFPGQRTVTFSSSGLDSCTTKVNVIPAVDRFISFEIHDDSYGADVIKTFDFLDGSEVGTMYPNAQSFNFEYNDSGSKLAVIPIGIGPVQIIDLASGASTYFAVPTGYTLHDIAFDPQNDSRYAIVGTQTANPDQHAIFIYVGNTQKSRFDMPLFAPSLRISRPNIAWSPDGSKISASFTQPAPAVNEYSLFMSEWNVVNDSITLPANGIYDNRPNLSNRETLRELVYQDDDWRAAASDLTVSLGIKRTTNEVIGSIFGVKNVDMDLPPKGGAAAFIQYIDLAAGDVAWPGFVTPLTTTTIPSVTYGPMFYPVTSKPTVAISSDARYVAVGLIDKVQVFSTPDFLLVKDIPAIRPRNLEFKPFE